MTAVGELCKALSGGTPRTSDRSLWNGTIPWITGADITSHGHAVPRHYITERAIKHSSTTVAPTGAVFLVTRTSVGKVAISDRPTAFSQDITALVPDNERVDTRYLARVLVAHERDLSRQARGATIRGVTRETVLALDVPLPSMEEQRRIADILDRTDRLRAARETAVSRIDDLVPAIFEAMFGKAGRNDMGWSVAKVGDYVARFQGGKSVESNPNGMAETGLRVLKISAVTGMRFRPTESKPVPTSFEPRPEYFVRPGDLLISRANTSELVGAVAQVRQCPSNLLLPDKLWRFLWKEPVRVHPAFVWALFQTSAVRAEVAKRATGTGGSMKNISQRKLLATPTILPPLDLQLKFAARVDRIEEARAKASTASKLAESLFTSLQYRAFHGLL